MNNPCGHIKITGGCQACADRLLEALGLMQVVDQYEASPGITDQDIHETDLPRHPQER